MKTQISKDTTIRTIVLILALVNNLLTVLGKSPLPISDEEAAEIISFILTTGAAMWAWWKNNDFTPEAKTGTAVMKELKRTKREGDKNDG